MTDITVLDVYDALWERVQTIPGFKTYAVNFTDYLSAPNGKPAIHLKLVSEELQNGINGEPLSVNLNFELYMQLDKLADPKIDSDRYLLTVRNTIARYLKAEPTDFFNTLGLNGWVNQCFLTGAEYFTDLSDTDDQMALIATIQVQCHPSLN